MPPRPALALAAAAAALAGAVLTAAPAPAAAAAQSAQPNLTGVWVPVNPPRALMQENGQPPPFTAEARRTYDERAAARRANRPLEDPAADCVPHGIPRLLTTPYPVEILQTPQRMAFVHEVNHTFRVIPLNRPRPPADELDPLWLGNSTARWEGDTLVIDTVGFNGMTWLDYAGAPTSEQLHVVERWRLGDGGRRLQVRLTIEDPKVFTRPWNTTLAFEKRDGLKLKESVCRENGVF